MRIRTTLTSLALLLFISLFANCGGSGRVKIDWTPVHAVNAVAPTVKVYIENSGSMDGYSCDGSQFKDAIHYIVNELDGYADTTELNFINSEVIPFSGDLNDFTLNLNPTSFQSYGGNRASSQLDVMFEKILKQMDDKTISVFTSDCILGVPYGQTSHFLNIVSDNVKSVFAKHIKKHQDFGVEIFCLSSKFVGNYYQYGQQPRKINCNRPYYVWFIGSQRLLGEMNKRIHLEKIPGSYLYEVGFSTCSSISFTITNEHGKSFGEGHSESRVSNSKGTFIIKADLSSTLQDDRTLCDMKNFIINPRTALVKLESVESNADADKDIFSHKITFKVFDKAHGIHPSIRVKTFDVPAWVGAMNDLSGSDMKKTQGIGFIINGVASAFSDNSKIKGINFNIK